MILSDFIFAAEIVGGTFALAWVIGIVTMFFTKTQK